MVYACAYHAKTDTAKFSKLGFMGKDPDSNLNTKH